jgi:hypothetical protein
MSASRLSALLIVSVCLPLAASAQSSYLPLVPDVCMPPAAAGGWPVVATPNWCTPTAGANIILYWDAGGYAGVAGNPAIPGKAVAYELGWFMDTNDWAVADDGHAGTFLSDPNASGFDAVNGIRNFARWDANNTKFGVGQLAPPGPRPAGKVGYGWGVSLILANGYANAVAEINAGRPLLTSFQHWGIVNTGQFANIGGINYPVYDFGANPGQIGGIDEYGNPWNQDFGLGHTVTTVGYFSNFILQGQNVNLLIVHDGVPAMGQGVVTPVDLAIVFRGNLWNGNINIDPVPEPNTLGVILVGGIALAAALRRR